MIFDRAKYRDLRRRHGFFVSATLAIPPKSWFCASVILGILFGIFTGTMQ
jgi:hypothetical protein